LNQNPKRLARVLVKIPSMPLRLATMLKSGIADKVNNINTHGVFYTPLFFARITMTEPTSDFLDNLAAKQHEKMLREVAGDHKNTDKDDEPQLLEE